MSPRDQRQRVLFVCTANICRSPTAEYIARARYGSDKFHFRSAGFMVAERGCPEDLQKVLGARNINVGEHRSYKLDQDTVTAADVIFTMESRHVLDATVLDRRALRKTLPLKEAANLVRPGESISEFLERVNAGRDAQKYLSDTDLDVADPYKKRLRAYEKAVEEIDELVTRVISSLRGAES